jgi:hypothetical protein
VREKHLIIDNDHFFAKEHQHRISDIDKVYFYYVQTQKTVNFTAAGIDHDVVVRLYLSGQSEPITSNSLGHFRFGNAGKKASEALIAKFNYLCSRTYTDRQARYLTYLHDDGFFIYDGKRICRNGDVIADQWQFKITQSLSLHSQFFMSGKGKEAFSGTRRNARSTRGSIQTCSLVYWRAPSV